MMRRIFNVTFCLLWISSITMGAADDSNDSKKEAISQVLYGVISEEGIDIAIEKYHSLQKENADDYDFSESQLNNLGYTLLNEKRNAEAIAILTLNVRMFPDSPNAYDSLGEAYMRAGDHEMAIKSYEKSLAMLATADIDDNTKNLLTKNAKSNLSYLRNPQSLMDSSVIDDFLSKDPEAPFGKLNPDAPVETKQFGQLAGAWRCINFAFVNGQWFSGWPATWVWKYTLDGYAVEDLWFQKRENLPPTSTLDRDVAGTNIRIYNPKEEKWEVAWFTNGSNSMSRFEAVFEDGEIVMKPPPVEGQPLRRIIFHDITKDSFQWKTQTSDDDGKTWTTSFRIEGRRIR